MNRCVRRSVIDICAEYAVYILQIEKQNVWQSFLFLTFIAPKNVLFKYFFAIDKNFQQHFATIAL